MALQHSKFEDVDQAMASQGINSVKVITMRQAFLNNVMRHMVPGTYFSIDHSDSHRTSFFTNKIYVYDRSEEHTSELQSLMRISYAVFCLKKKKINNKTIKSIKHNTTTSLER